MYLVHSLIQNIRSQYQNRNLKIFRIKTVIETIRADEISQVKEVDEGQNVGQKNSFRYQRRVPQPQHD